MSAPVPQPRPPIARLAVAIGLAACLGGCLSKSAGPETTGSLAAPAGSDEDLRRDAQALGDRYAANPGDASNAIAYARVLRARRQTAQALAVLQQAALRNPNEPSLLAAYGKVLADSGRLKEASEILTRAHRPDRPDWRILNVQGAIADQMGDFANAQRFYEAALKIAPGEPSILSNQGLSFALARRLAEAETVLTTAAAHPQADARVRQNLALVQELKARAAGAKTMPKRALPVRQAAAAEAAIGPVKQADSWKALRQADAEASLPTP